MPKYIDYEMLWESAHQPSLKRYGRLKLEYKTYLYKNPDDTFSIRFYETEIIRFTKNGMVILNVGKWSTNSSIKKINRFSDIGVFRRYNNLYIELCVPNTLKVRNYKFINGMTVVPFFNMVMLNDKIVAPVSLKEEEKEYRRNLRFRRKKT